MGLMDDLSGLKVALDTSIFIYFLEENPSYTPLVKPIFVAAESKQVELYTSVITLLEVMVLPYRQNRQDLLLAYQQILENNEAITLIPANVQLVKEAAQLRANYTVRTPDALQLAAAIVSRADVFLTNDVRLKTITEVPVRILKDYLP